MDGKQPGIVANLDTSPKAGRHDRCWAERAGGAPGTWSSRRICCRTTNFFGSSLKRILLPMPYSSVAVAIHRFEKTVNNGPVRSL